MGYDVVALGELLVDFTPAGNSGQGNPCFEANPGGAPCNVLAMLAKLGHSTAFLGKVGGDMHGRRLAAVVADAGIDTTGLIIDETVDTTLAFVALNEEGDRDFSFFRRPGADTMLTREELNRGILAENKLFHFGSLSLTNEPVRGATREALRLARLAGSLVSFDPNLREPLWESMAQAKEQMLWGCAQSDIVKLAREELEFLAGTPDWRKARQWMAANYPNIRLLLVTDGKNGARAYAGETTAERPTYRQVCTVDTTGAGDTFMGCCLHKVLQHGLEGLTETQLKEMLDFANAAASLVTTQKGAIRSMPTVDSIKALQQEGPKG